MYCSIFIVTSTDQSERDAEPSADGTEVGASVTLTGIWQHLCPLPALCAKTPASISKWGFHKETRCPLLPPSGLHPIFLRPLFSSQTSSHLLSTHLPISSTSVSVTLSLTHCSSPSPYPEHLIPVTGFVLEGFGKFDPLLQPLPPFPDVFFSSFLFLSLSPFFILFSFYK